MSDSHTERLTTMTRQWWPRLSRLALTLLVLLILALLWSISLLVANLAPLLLALALPGVALLAARMRRRSASGGERPAADAAGAATLDPSAPPTENERRWIETVLDLLPTPLLLVEPGSARVLFANKAADRLTNGEIPRDGLAAISAALPYCTDDDGNRLTFDQLPIVRAARGEQLHDLRIFWHTRGEIRALIVQAQMLPEMYGQPAAAMLTFQDVTALNQAAGLSARLGKILDESANEIYFCDAETLLFGQVNQGARRNLGYTAEELAKLTPLDLKPEFTAAQYNQLIAPLRSGERERITFETVHRRKDGSLYPVEVQLQLSRSETPPVLVAIIQDITARHAADEALRRSEERFRIAAQSASDLIYEWDIVTGTLEWFGDVDGRLGYAPGTFPRTLAGWEQALHAEDRARVMAAIDEHLQTRAPFFAEYRVVRADGSVRIWTDRGRVLWDDAGQPVRWVGVTADITERRASEAALRESEDRFRTLFESTPFGVAIARHGISLYVNPAYLQIFGYDDPSEVVGMSLLNQIAPECRAEIADRNRRREAGEAVASFYETVGLRRDGSRFPYQVRVARITLADGPASVAFAQDITELKRAEAALRQSEARYRSLVIASAQMIWTTRADGEVVEDIPLWREFTGLRPEDVLGSGWLRAVHPDDRERTARLWAEALANRSIYYNEYRLRGADGVYRYFSVRGVPVLEADGSIREWVGSCADITEQREADHALRFVAEASAVLATSLDVHTTLQTLADLALPVLADCCTIHALTDDGQIRQLAVAHVDSAQTDLIWELERRHPIDPTELYGLPLVIFSREPEIVPEVDEARLRFFAKDAEHLRLLEALHLRSSMCLPLVARGRTLGAITLMTAQSERRYSEADVALAQELAGRAAIAIDNARLFEAEQQARRSAERSAERTLRLQQVTAALSEALTPEQVAGVVIEHALTALEAEASLITMLSDHGQMLEVIGSAGYSEEKIAPWRRFPLSAPVPLAEAVRTAAPVWLESAAQRAARYPHLAQAYTTSNYRAWMSVPMLVEGRAVGGVALSFPSERVLSDDERSFMLALAGQCGQAIIRARLYAAERAARTHAEQAQRRLQFLAEASAALSASLDYAVTLTNLARLAVPMLADICLVDILDDDGSVQRVGVAHRDPAKDALVRDAAKRFPPDLSQSSLMATVLREGRSALLTDMNDEAVMSIARSPEHLELMRRVGQHRALMIVPLVARGRTLGALSFAITDDERQYDQGDLALAEDLARRAATAIDNARLYRDAQAAERAKQESLALLDTLFETAPVGLGFFDRELRYARVNDALAAINGISAAEHLGHRVPELLPRIPPQVIADLEQVLATGVPVVDREVAGETPALPGRRRYWLSSYYPVRGTDPEPQGLGVVVTEITERKQAEEAQRFLAEASALLVATLDYEVTLASVARLVVPRLADWCAITLVDEDGTIRRLTVAHPDPAMVELANELYRRFPIDPNAPYGVPQTIRSGKSELLSEIPDEMLVRAINDPEQLRIMRSLGLRSSMVVPLIARGRTLGAITFVAAESGHHYDTVDLALAEDLASRAALAVDNARLYRAAQDAFHTAQQRAAQLRGLTDASLAINAALTLDEALQIITDQARLVIGAHQAVASFTTGDDWAQAISATSLSEKYAPFRDYAAPTDGSEIYALVCRTNTVMRLSQAELEEHPAWQSVGAAAVAHPPMRGWLAAPLTGRGGRNVGLLQLSDKYTGDFTESDEAIIVQLAQMASVAIENARLYQEAQEAILARDDFLSIASHELKTPLTSLQLQAQSLLRLAQKGGLESISKERLRSKLELIDQQALRLTRLANDLLDVARIRTGRIDFRLEEVDLLSVARDVVARFEEQIAQAGCEVTIAAAAAVVVSSDRSRLDQVLTNLLSNAIKYGAGKAVTIEIEADAEQARLTVRDQGIGIASEHLERIFVRFERAVSARNYGGLGLGLYIVRQIVESLGGSVRVASEPGVGSAFTVSLPRRSPPR